MIVPTIVITELDIKSILDRFSADKQVCALLVSITGVVAANYGILDKLLEQSVKTVSQNKYIKEHTESLPEIAHSSKLISQTYRFFATVAYANGLANAIRVFFENLPLHADFIDKLAPSDEVIGRFIATVASNTVLPWEEVGSAGANDKFIQLTMELQQALSDIGGENIVLGHYPPEGQPYLYAIALEDAKRSVDAFYDTLGLK